MITNQRAAARPRNIHVPDAAVPRLVTESPRGSRGGVATPLLNFWLSFGRRRAREDVASFVAYGDRERVCEGPGV